MRAASASYKVWDANRGAWYFWNAKTNETTWTNPLEGTASAEAEASTLGASAPAANISDEELAQMHNLDPDLAYLDPGLYASQLSEARQAYNTSRGGGGSSNSNAIAAGAYATKGTFDARTGKFVPAAKTAEYDPSRLSHANQADRQMGAFFDVDAYNEERRRLREEEDMIEQAGGSRKRKPTKQDIQFYQQRKKGEEGREALLVAGLRLPTETLSIFLFDLLCIIPPARIAVENVIVQHNDMNTHTHSLSLSSAFPELNGEDYRNPLLILSLSSAIRTSCSSTSRPSSHVRLEHAMARVPRWSNLLVAKAGGSVLENASSVFEKSVAEVTFFAGPFAPLCASLTCSSSSSSGGLSLIAKVPVSLVLVLVLILILILFIVVPSPNGRVPIARPPFVEEGLLIEPLLPLQIPLRLSLHPPRHVGLHDVWMRDWRQKRRLCHRRWVRARSQRPRDGDDEGRVEAEGAWVHAHVQHVQLDHALECLDDVSRALDAAADEAQPLEARHAVQKGERCKEIVVGVEVPHVGRQMG
ncbi:hypothetical protein L7F22_069081 [Adiantum nelumboides]|nr:hypothetical protein [Adiantum nelumboides]